VEAPAVRLRKAVLADVPALLDIINGYARRGQLLSRTEASLRERLADFIVAEVEGQVVGGAALTELGPGLAEVRSLAVREGFAGRGIGHALVEAAVAEAARRGLHEVLALTRRTSFFAALGFEATRRERYLDKLMVDCQTCPMNLCCDETAMVRVLDEAGAGPEPVETVKEGASVE
jgi:amino-acid N-acetyltransferase